VQPVRSAGEGPEAVVVCGAGAAGLAAALAAARAGAAVQLVEARPRPGGTVTAALIHTLGGLYDGAGKCLNGGLARELADVLTQTAGAVRRRIGRAWVLSVCPDAYGAVVRHWIESEPRIIVHFGTRVVGIVRNNDRVQAVEAAGPSGLMHLAARAVIDATGTAEAVRRIDPGLVRQDPRGAAGGLIFTLRGVAAGALAFPRGLAVVRAVRAAAADGTLPAECGHAWVDIGTYPDEVYVKLLVPLPDDRRDRENDSETLRGVLKTQAAVVAFLRRMPDFAAAMIGRTGRLGVRDGGRVRGEYCLSGSDVRQLRRFPDAACRCSWPIEYWDPEQGVSLEYLPEGGYYEIPLRSLKVLGLRNAWAAGKCLSADREAQASARVVGTCWSMGEAAGKAAAEH
jgi:NADPH-dependent 2,4-dienoyl-CoA reductase/sulfur reductase-like enzyme